MRITVNRTNATAIEFDLPDVLTAKDLKNLIAEETGFQSAFLHRQGKAIADNTVLNTIDPGKDEVAISMIDTSQLLAPRSNAPARNPSSTTPQARPAAPQYNPQARQQMQQPTPQQQQQQQALQHQRLLDEALTNALEEHPESFIQVCMLYVPVLLDGVECLGFVDTGAQHSILDRDLAKKAGIDHLIDPRLAGKAVGVGQSNIVGKIMSTPIKIGDGYYPTSFAVLESSEGGMAHEIILGLDFMRRHRATVDLGARTLTLMSGATALTIPFLEEQQLPEDKRPKHAAVFSQMPGQPRQRPMPQQQAQQPQQQAVSAAVLEGKVDQLVAMGFDAGRARSALMSTQGDLDRALDFLTSG
ncbi:Aspartyl protease [Carpediemonas membranifera]|uniref:Aspartyl protease n=1 Tax=Carpediemonas membranifera TaxID=201153 RepID=A0A8J6C1H7_9EUKA|nr:Aspartyl protease [Carpediemonas membranifera]|eukprot:KAG9397596.1 Aspartyl protease [Carpediemonas membranifera]